MTSSTTGSRRLPRRSYAMSSREGPTLVASCSFSMSGLLRVEGAKRAIQIGHEGRIPAGQLHRWSSGPGMGEPVDDGGVASREVVDERPRASGDGPDTRAGWIVAGFEAGTQCRGQRPPLALAAAGGPRRGASRADVAFEARHRFDGPDEIGRVHLVRPGAPTHPSQAVAQAGERLDLLFDACKVLAQDRRKRLALVEGPPDPGERHAEVPKHPNPVEAPDRRLGVQPVAAFRAGRPFKQPDRFVVVERSHREPGRPGEIADSPAHAGHGGPGVRFHERNRTTSRYVRVKPELLASGPSWLSGDGVVPSSQHPAGERAGVLAVVDHDDAVDDDVWDPLGELVRALKGRAIDHPIRVEDRDVGKRGRLEASAAL